MSSLIEHVINAIDQDITDGAGMGSSSGDVISENNYFELKDGESTLWQCSSYSDRIDALIYIWQITDSNGNRSFIGIEENADVRIGRSDICQSQREVKKHYAGTLGVALDDWTAF